MLPAGVVETLRRDHGDALADVAERAALYETADPVPYGVIVTDGSPARMAIELREGSLITGLITNETPAAAAWARETVDRYREGATPVEV